MPVVRDLYCVAVGSYLNLVEHDIDRPQGRPDDLFIYCVGGKGFGTVGGRRYELRKGDAIFFPAGRPHAYGADPGDPYKIYWFHFAGRAVPDYLRLMEVAENRPLLYLPDPEALIPAFVELQQYVVKGASRADFLSITAHLSRFLALVNLRRQAAAPRARSVDENLTRTIGYMREHVESHLKLGELAQMAGLSITHYSALFRRKTGFAPVDYFIRLRMQRACRLLAATRDRVQDVARQMGYEDVYYFSRLFSRVMGTSPGRYRRMPKG